MQPVKGSAAEAIEPLAVTIPETMRLTGLGKNSVYEEIEAGRFESALVAGRRLVIVASIKRTLAERAAIPFDESKRKLRKRGRPKTAPRELEAI
jgi:predicted DNA-binding transcriptional regulator AlpA